MPVGKKTILERFFFSWVKVFFLQVCSRSVYLANGTHDIFLYMCVFVYVCIWNVSVIAYRFIDPARKLNVLRSTLKFFRVWKHFRFSIFLVLKILSNLNVEREFSNDFILSLIGNFILQSIISTSKSTCIFNVDESRFWMFLGR